jgi:hypothetical protein
MVKEWDDISQSILIGLVNSMKRLLYKVMVIGFHTK